MPAVFAKEALPGLLVASGRKVALFYCIHPTV